MERDETTSAPIVIPNETRSAIMLVRGPVSQSFFEPRLVDGRTVSGTPDIPFKRRRVDVDVRDGKGTVTVSKYTPTLTGLKPIPKIVIH